MWCRNAPKMCRIVSIALATAMSLATHSVVNGQEDDGSEPDAAQLYRMERLAALDADREAFVKGLAEQWASPANESAENLYEIFRRLNSDKLLAIQDATSFDNVRLIMMGQEPGDTAFLEALASEPVEPLVLGALDRDFVYTPVDPCRIVDTRPSAGGAGTIPAGGTRNYVVHGAVAGQGGNPAGCPSPRGEPRAAHLNVTVVPVGTGNGFVQVWPFGSPAPTASLVNFRGGSFQQNIANAGTIKTGFLLGPDITVRVNGAAAHVIIDVLGYYHEAEGSQEDRVFSGVNSVPNSPVTVVGSLSIFVPGPGKVMVHASGYGAYSGADTRLRFGIGDNTTAYDRSVRSGLSNGTDSLDRSFPMHAQHVYTVNGPSNKTIYLLTDREDADDSFNANLAIPTLTALYVPE